MTQTPDTPAFLNVDTSATGRRWVGPTVAEDRAAEAMAQATTLPPPLCRTLAKRGVAPEDADAFLAPTLRDLLPDPHAMRDMQKAAARFLSAVKSRQKIAIFADYDVDGGSSAALLITWLRDMGLPATLYIPDRIDEG
ncbi:MAG: single-stranded-DNA-specific exonuclease RecJ, partial [Yoonia sp.]|nr:single-stranded-DNA-specific exonuclease RecJ [Yoonia sp.]